MSKAAKKVLDEARESGNPEIELQDKQIAKIEDLPGLLTMEHITRLTLSHNRLSSLPPAIAHLTNLEILNLYNNHLVELPVAISSLNKLRILNVGMNRLDTLPRGFGSFPVLEVLDFSYNNISEETLPGNFFMLESLRALYMADNDFEILSPEIKNFKNLQILVLRDNDLVDLPREVGELHRLRELHLQSNRLQVLPPEISYLDLQGSKSCFRIDGNHLIQMLADQLLLGISHVIDIMKTPTYKFTYERHQKSNSQYPPKNLEAKDRKISRVKSQLA
ncbi:ras suppressor protein 1 [Hyalella azteca]|uniref:Ras suppressor protein 1 n=1 Tax=Hyalella azteca TaxID=294128 RepID=A0A8B7NY18_HYAAZ|nr:ras suppressor protein 1 [Hyalella azteca]